MDFVGPILEILKCIGSPLCKLIEYHRKRKEYKQNLKKRLEELKNQKDKIETRLKTFKNEKCLSLVYQAKIIQKKIQQVEEYLQKDAGTILPTIPLVGETTTKKNMEEVWRHLMDNEIKNVGIFGMSGVGTKWNYECIETKPFGYQNKKIWAGMLLSMLKGKRFVLILDDIWEALELFFEKVELDISKVPTLKETAELVVKQCAASSLKAEEDIRERRNALSELTNKVRSIKVKDEEIFVRLKFNFDRLTDKKIQRCFLYCALYPEDHDIPKTELIDCWIAGLVGEMDLQATEDRPHIIIKNLVNNCLLLDSINRREGNCVKLHDVVREWVLRYITSKSHLLMVKAGLKLKELLSKTRMERKS
ncbi:hypothetical protein ACOSQ4_015867 [Xanthoceras sorbifolium]